LIYSDFKNYRKASDGAQFTHHFCSVANIAILWLFHGEIQPNA